MKENQSQMGTCKNLNSKLLISIIQQDYFWKDLYFPSYLTLNKVYLNPIARNLL